MKKSLPFASTLCFLAAQFLASPTASVFAQGTVIFNNRSSGTSHVYAPLGSPYDDRLVGNGANDGPPVGSVDYGGRAYIGANGTGGQYGAASTLAQLLGAPGATAPESSLIPAMNAPSSFRTGINAGFVAGSIATFNNIAPDATVASFEMVAWDNSSGLYPTWAQASVAWGSGVLIAAGRSPEFRVLAIGGFINAPPPLFPVNGDTTPELQSFNIYQGPEPTTAALAALAAVISLILRRRK